MGLFEKVQPGKDPWEGGSHRDLWGKSILGRVENKCKGPEAPYAWCVQGTAGAESVKGRAAGEEVREVGETGFPLPTHHHRVLSRAGTGSDMELRPGGQQGG